MGVPKFYRWISERYPCLSEVVKDYQIPEFDNLYLDMNGIIHVCSHPNDDDPKFRITEEKILKDISHYIEALFRLIKPKKVFFMAVDGVAPRAKMNQQRGRRFRSAREAAESEQRAIQRGEVLPTEQRFDSNCITPGTPFMTKLQQHLKYFVTKKISTDRTWQGIRIYLSGHNTPGEGEHKIMDFIRSEKARPDYDSHVRHCLYGLDADLIMLGMCTHDIHFSLLREEVRFGGKKSQKRTPTFEETTFHLLHLSLLRDYLDHEFSCLKTKLTFTYDLEKIIDDWILMGFLVGNDFIPNLPHLHIAQSSLSRLYQTYMEVLPTLDGYINEEGYLNLKRFEKYMGKLAELDYEHFEEFFSDFKWLETRKPENEGAWKSKKVADKKQLEALKLATEELLLDIDDDEEENEELDDEAITKNIADMEFYQNKRDYYTNKLNYPKFNEEVLKDQAEVYVRAIQWTLHYYYNGVCSWSWYYPHHYAPFISDITNFSHLKLDFQLGEPFLPFQQLLAVLPAASKQFLPKPYQSLMYDVQSPIIDYYPINFETDLNGKQQDWEAVVLLPFIDEQRLLDAMRPLTDLLTDEERKRNSHGPCSLFSTSNEPLGGYLSYWPSVFPNIDINYAKCEEISLDAFKVDPNMLVKGLCKGIDLEICFLGFPTLRYIPHTATLKKAEVKVFQQNSRGENMILEVQMNIDMSSLKVMEELIGCCIFVGWPHLVEAKVTHMSDGQNKYISQQNQIQLVEMNKNEVNGWRMEAASVKEHYLKRWGINVGEIKVLVYACQLVGFKKILNKSGKVVEEKQYSKNISPFALQAVIKDLKFIRSLKPNESYNVQQLFPVKSPCFILTMGENYGRQAEIVKVVENGKRGVSVEVKVLKTVQEPDLQTVIDEYQKHVSDYLAPREACHRLGISCNLLSRITSLMHISASDQKVNIGLNMKSAKRDEEMAGYTRKSCDGWRYSYKAIETVEEYIKKFPELFEFLAGHPATSEMLQEEDLLINCPNLTLSEVSAYLKSLPSYSFDCHPCGSDFVPETLVKDVEECTCDINEKKMLEEKILTIRPHQLYVPNNVVAMSDDLPPDPSSSISMLDRVIYVKEGGPVPLGLKGVVVGIILGSNPIYEVLFDSTFEGAYSIRGFSCRVYRLQNVHIINLSHGNRIKVKGGDLIYNRKPTAVVHPHQETTKLLQKNGRRDRNHINKQPAVVSGQSPKKPTSINHSPNSPFVPSKPYFYTPTMTTDYKSSGSVPNTRDGEFQEMWKQLRSNKQQIRGVADGGGSPALIQAAKSLPKRRTVNAAVSTNHAAASGGGASAAPPTNEFSNFLQALEKQPAVTRTKTKPLEDLLFLLKNKESTSCDQSLQIRPGQSIPLEELFRSPEKSTQLHQQSHIQKTSEGHYRTAPINHVMTLMTLSQQLLRSVPIYTYYPTQEKQVVAQVALSNGISVTSPPCLTRQEASEIAAKLAKNELITLNQLVGNQKAPVGFTPYVQPYLVGNNFRPPMIRPPLIFQPNAVRQHRPQQQKQQFHKPRPQLVNLAQSIPSTQNQPLQTGNIVVSKNPFVPLQVTKQTKSGKGGMVTLPSNDQPLTKADGSGINELTKNLDSTIEISAPLLDDNKNKKKPTKKRKSKLAINFNAVSK